MNGFSESDKMNNNNERIIMKKNSNRILAWCCCCCPKRTINMIEKKYDGSKSNQK